PLLDSLRGVAILMVVAYHAAATAGVSTTRVLPELARQGFVGVMLFFTLSGFLIYRPFVAARDSDRGPPGLLRYWRRRTLRILPAGLLSDVLASSFPGMALFFAIGMALAAASVRIHGREQDSSVAQLVRRHPDLCWLGGFGAFAAAATVFGVQTVANVAHSWSHLYGNYVLSGLGAALLVAPAVFGQGAGGISRWLVRTSA